MERSLQTEIGRDDAWAGYAILPMPMGDGDRPQPAAGVGEGRRWAV